MVRSVRILPPGGAASGAHRLTVQAKDSKGVTFKQTININVTQDAQPH
ncbi:MAG: hypothetical protein ABI383_05760 [Acidobacteriaceae bacterium]